MTNPALKKKPLPVRRVVKRGAPPIITPRRNPLRVGVAAASTAGRGRPSAEELKQARDLRTREREARAEQESQHERNERSDRGAADAETESEAETEADAETEAEENDKEQHAGDETAESGPREGAELEAAAPAKVKREQVEPSTFLARYFREMSELEVLKPEAEFRQARDLEGLESALWARILSYAPIVEHALLVIERTLENSLAEFRPLRKARTDHRRSQSRVQQTKLDSAAVVVADRLRAIDIDKRLIDAVLLELGKIATGDPSRLVLERLDVSPRQVAFRRYHGEVMAAKRRGMHAKNEFVKANLRLVVSIARRFNHGRMPLADLIQEGNIGLIKAVERYDYRRGFRFSTYASWWIRHAISRALADKGRAVRLPVHMIDAYHRIAKAKRELANKLGRDATSEEIGVAAGIATAKIEKMRTFLLDQSISLDRPVSDEDGRRLIDLIQPTDDESLSPVDSLANEAVTAEVRSLLHELKPIEADILRRRFGLLDDKELTLKEIGEKYDLSRERIRQLQEQALLKMRRALQLKDLL